MRAALIPRPIRRQLPLKSLFIQVSRWLSRCVALALLSRCSESFSVPITAVATSLSVGPVVKTKVESATGARAIRPPERLHCRDALCNWADGLRACERATYFQPAPINQATAANQLKLAAATGAQGDILPRSSRRGDINQRSHVPLHFIRGKNNQE
jgi:hypothetical protein